MSGLLRLALLRLAHHRASTAILAVALAITVAVPIAARAITREFERSLRARADGTPLVVGAAGSRFDLLFAALHLRPSAIPTVAVGTAARIARPDEALVIPFDLRHAARGRVVLGAPPEYAEFRGLRCVRGQLPRRLGQVALGAAAARALGLDVGDRVTTDPVSLFDIAAPAPVTLVVSGVLAPTGQAEDEVLLAPLATAWAIDGRMHGHAGTDGPGVMARTEGHAVMRPDLLEMQSIDAEALASFHLHGDPDAAPVTGFVVLPKDAREATIVRTRADALPGLQALVPSVLFEELLAFAVRLRTLVEAIAAVLGAATLLLAGLLVALSVRARAPELRTLARLGCPRGTAAMLVSLELALVAVAAALLAVALAAGVAGAARALTWMW